MDSRARRAAVILGFIATGAVVGYLSMPGRAWTPAGVLTIEARPLFRGDAALLGPHLDVVGDGEFDSAYRGPPAKLEYGREVWNVGVLVRGPDWGGVVSGSRFRAKVSFSLREPESDAAGSPFRLMRAIVASASDEGHYVSMPREESIELPTEPDDLGQWRSGPLSGSLRIGEDRTHVLWVGAGTEWV